MNKNKSAAEARVERLTWGLLVLIFAVLYVLSDSALSQLPNFLVPLAGGVILIASGLYQYSRRWRVSPITWIAGVLMLVFAVLSFYILPDRSFIVETLIATLIVIIVGTFTGET
jgi:Na+/melibiose symporter-like transporter